MGSAALRSKPPSTARTDPRDAPQWRSAAARLLHFRGAMAAELPPRIAGRKREVREVRLEDLERLARGRRMPLREWLALAEAWRIAQALREQRGNRAATARALGIGRRTLFTKMEKLGLVPSWGVVAPDHSPHDEL